MRGHLAALLVCASCASTSMAQWAACPGGICYSGGNVGIGTSTPSAPLSVVGAGLFTGSGAGIGVGGAVTSGYQFYGATNTPGLGAGAQFNSSYVNPGSSYVGNFGTW